MQNFLPIFESGQVLTNAHLNELATYLEQQQRASRYKLFGIGVLCGLQATLHNSGVAISKGIAVSSSGLLIEHPEDLVYTGFKPYQLPTSDAVEDDASVDETQVADLLPLEDIDLFEMVTNEYVRAPGEAAPQLLSSLDLSDTVVMLLLEEQTESLKNCQVNDCADKGAQRVYVLRVLLLKREDAARVWESETTASSLAMPRDLAWQSIKHQLSPVDLPALYQKPAIDIGFEDIANRASEIVNDTWPKLKAVLGASFEVWAYVLKERFPESVFPNDPWSDINLTLPMPIPSPQELIERIFAYDALKDIVASYNEFLTCALEYEALCLPSTQRFAYHVMLGRPQLANAVRNRTDSQFEIGAFAPNLSLRHPFYPSLALGEQRAIHLRMQELYYRTYLMCKRAKFSELGDKELKLSSSMINAALSQKAIPFYFQSTLNDDLHRHWWGQGTRLQQLNQVHGYDVSSSNPHPLLLGLVQHDFYRVEGVMGKPLASIISQLREQQHSLGAEFSIAPVLLPLAGLENDEQRAIYLKALLTDDNLQRLFKCKLRDLDVIFLLLMAVIFQLLVALVYLLARAGGTKTTVSASAESSLDAQSDAGVTVSASNEQPSSSVSTNVGASRFISNYQPLIFSAIDEANIQNIASITSSSGLFSANFNNSQINTSHTDLYLSQIRTGNMYSSDMLSILDEESDPNGKIGEIYSVIRENPSSDLYNAVASLLGNKDDQGEVDQNEVEKSVQAVRSLGHAENLMRYAGEASISSFNFERFSSELEQLNDADAKRRDGSASDDALSQSISSNVSMLNSLSNSAVLSTMRTEFQNRLESIFDSFLWSGFGQDHPGMHHQCGVPKGGTLVLAYMPKAIFEKYRPKSIEKASTVGSLSIESTNGAALREAFFTESMLTVPNEYVAYALGDSNDVLRSGRFMLDNTGFANVDTISLLTNREAEASSTLDFSFYDSVNASEAVYVSPDSYALPNVFESVDWSRFLTTEESADPLDEMIVVADFCLSANCCDSDCGDIETYKGVEEEEQAPPVFEQPAPSEVTIKGRVVSATNKGLSAFTRSISEIIPEAQVVVFDTKDNRVTVKMAKGSFSFTVLPGEYRIMAGAKGYETREKTQTIKQDDTQEMVIALTKTSNSSDADGSVLGLLK